MNLVKVRIYFEELKDLKIEAFSFPYSKEKINECIILIHGRILRQIECVRYSFC